MSIETWLLFILFSILPAISPGPGVLLAISNALRFGTKAALLSGLGNSIGLTILGYAVTMGLGAVMATSAMMFTVIKMIGAVYLLYLGVKVFRDKTAFRVDGMDMSAARSNKQLFGTAIVVSLTNPKSMFLIGALFPQFVGPDAGDLVNITILSFTFAVMCFFNHVFLAVFGGRMRQFLQSEKIVRRLRHSLGAVFIGFGATLATYTRQTP